MKRFKNILVVYDGNVGAEDALNQAMMLAEANAAQLTLVDLVEEGRYSFSSIKERERRLQRLLPAIRADSVGRVSAKVLMGTPFLEIIKSVLRDGHDLMIASAEDGSVVKSVFFGSTVTHLIRKCPCPVWIVKPGQIVPYGRILAAVDPKPDDPTGDGLNIEIMDLATSLARMTGAGLDVLHAWEVTGRDSDTLMSEVPPGTREAIIGKHEDRRRETLGALLQRYPLNDIDHELLLPRGLPQQEIVEAVQARDVDLIVMGTISRTGIPGLLMGTAAETIFEAVTCGVIAVKPDGFVTPVTLH
ncbi:MAG: universal stress protein [Rhizobiales bacterium]|nr:universal stress protein [Hyphomicrobiales bacterium]